PREVVFVIDTSGSMGGEPIRQAKQSLLWALQRLQAEDRFNIVQFNSITNSLFSDAQQAVPGVLNRARSYVNGLQANGGTEMLAAVDAALCEDCDDPGRVRQVIFITDGAIGNEDQLFRAIRSKIGDSRLFTVGIGSAPNSYFMRRAAEFGRGTFTYIANTAEVGEKMAQLYRKLEAPLLTDLQLSMPHGVDAELLPNLLPDLYAGEPLVASVKMPPSSALLTVSGRIGTVAWQQQIELMEGQSQPGVQQLWARKKIQQLNDLRRNQHDPVVREELRDQLVALSLKHHLVSPFTSLVAVDVTPVRPMDEALKSHKVASNMPKGTRFALPQTATPAGLWWQMALLCLMLAVLVYLLQRHRSWPGVAAQ
ncbi:MAG: VWA domain-containing protein, partial [Porticoccaceae bacterium]|nr:VWA domain-containing protein [Porticoccaceae bacterium]